MSSEDSDTDDVNGGNKLRTLLYYVVACIYNSGCRRQTVVKTRERIGLWPCRFIRPTPLHVAFCFLHRMSQEWAKSREEGWDNTKDTRIKEYNALFDPNMRHFFETPSVQGHLLRTGQVGTQLKNVHTYIRGHSQTRGGIVVQSARYDSSRINFELRSGEAER